MESQTNAGLGREHYWLFLITLDKTWSNSSGKLWHFFFSPATILTALWDIRFLKVMLYLQAQNRNCRPKIQTTQYTAWTKVFKKKRGNKLSFSSQCLPLRENMLSNRPRFFPLSLERISLLSIKHTSTVRIALDSSNVGQYFQNQVTEARNTLKWRLDPDFQKLQAPSSSSWLQRMSFHSTVGMCATFLKNQATYLES